MPLFGVGNLHKDTAKCLKCQDAHPYVKIRGALPGASFWLFFGKNPEVSAGIEAIAGAGVVSRVGHAIDIVLLVQRSAGGSIVCVVDSLNEMGVIAGVTTNPSLIAKEGRDYAETLAEIATIVDGPISGEVKATTTDAEGMVKEGEAIYALDPKQMVVKIPMTAEGLKAIKQLSAKGIPTNCTLIFTANQALLAARAGATYVSPFLGRLDDISQRGIELVETIHDMFLNYPDIETQIIAASVRNPIHVTDCALAGADIATVPYKVIEQMLHHPLTDAGIEKFKADYCKVFGE